MNGRDDMEMRNIRTMVTDLDLMFVSFGVFEGCKAWYIRCEAHLLYVGFWGKFMEGITRMKAKIGYDTH
jgi:hypothetical protein